MVAVVNGYVCFTTCDAKQARQGKDPLALNGASSGASPDSKKKNGLDGQPATVLGGALNNLKDALDAGRSSDPGNPAAGGTSTPPSSASSRLDVFA